MKNERIVSIDRYRGILVFVMILFQYVERYDCFGIISKFAYHTPSLGIEIFPNFALADFVAPCFFLALAFTFRPSFDRAVEKLGKKEAYLKFIKRSCKIIGLGSCICTCDGIFYGFKGFFIGFETFLTVACILLGLLSLVEKLLKNRNTVLAKAKPALHGVLTVLGAATLVFSVYSLITVEINTDAYTSWGVLEAIGAAEIIVLIFINQTTLVRAVVSVVMILLYAWIHSLPNMMVLIDEFIQGGILGAFSWASMIMVFTVFADFFYYDRAQIFKGKKSYRYLIATIVADIFGCYAAKCLYLNRGSINTGFVLLTIAFAVTTFGLFALTEKYKPKFALFVWWGESSIILFLLQYLFVNIPLSLIPGAEDWTLVPASIYGVLLMGTISYIAYRLDKKENRIRF